jgi:hypothetical protein
MGLNLLWLVVGQMVEIPVGAWHAAYNDVCTISVNETCMTAAEVPQVSCSAATGRL